MPFDIDLNLRLMSISVYRVVPGCQFAASNSRTESPANYTNETSQSKIKNVSGGEAKRLRAAVVLARRMGVGDQIPPVQGVNKN